MCPFKPPLPDHIYCTLVSKIGFKKSGKIASLIPQMCVIFIADKPLEPLLAPF